MDITVDIRVPVGRSLPELVTFVRSCSDAGFDGVGMHDHHHSGRDVYAALALAASATQRLRLYPATSNPVTRHPLVLAATMNSLTEIAPGRVLLTLAPGFLSVEKAGQPQARRQQLAEAVTAIRGLLRDGHARMGGNDLQLNNLATPPAEVFVLASGPKMLELAGEVADGVVMLVGLDPGGINQARAHLREGAHRAGRDPASLAEIFIVPTAIGGFAWAHTWPRTYFRPGQPFLHYPSAANLHWLRTSGIDVPTEHRPERLSPQLAERICDSLGLFGPPEHCADRLIRAHEQVGMRHVFLFPAHTAESGYQLPEHERDAFRDIIGPRLR